MSTSTTGGIITEHEAWNIAIADLLDVTGTVLDQLAPAAREEITRILAREVPNYIDCEDLARRTRAAVNRLDYIN